ncbi:putative nucleoside diphosphate kinase [Globomyces pollinis-pini]|nr:putative nucleoside diphosphate kinase [Globomyces pollinis-pini]
MNDDPKVRYCFVAEWFDVHAQLYRNYEFFFYPSDCTIEMYDTKQRRTFLKRSKSDLKLHDLFLGAAINVHARQLLIRDFADDFTRSALSTTMESTLLIIKPSGLKFLGSILNGLAQNQFTLCRLRMMNITANLAKSLNDVDQSFNGGKSIVMELLKPDVITNLHNVLKDSFSKWTRNSKLNDLIYTPENLNEAQTKLQWIFENQIDFKRTAKFQNCTLCIIRPHAIISGIHGNIIQSIIDHGGFELSDLELLHLDNTNAEEFLEVYKGVVPEYQMMLSQLTTGPLIAIELIGDEDIVSKFRDFVGPSDPSLAARIRPKSLRALYGQDKVKNAVHCTDLPEDGPLESEYFFKIL